MSTAPMWTATAHPAVSTTFVPARPVRSRSTALYGLALHGLVGAVAITLLLLALGPHTAGAATPENTAGTSVVQSGSTTGIVRTDVTSRAARGDARSGAPAAVGQAARTSVSRAARSTTTVPVPLRAHRVPVTPAGPTTR